jgi:alanyl-tRNA synthetase
MVDGERIRFDFSHGATGDARPDRSDRGRGERGDPPEPARRPQLISTPQEAMSRRRHGAVRREVRRQRACTDARSRPGGEGAYSVELCGGTHVERSGDIAVFTILSESGVSAGVRRIEAATGAEALAYLKGRAQIAADVADSLKVPLKDLPKRVATLSEDRRALERELAEAKRKLAMGGGGGAPSGPEVINGVNLVARIAEGVGGKDLRTLVDETKAQLGSGIVVFIGTEGGKAGVAVGVTADLTAKYSAVDLVKVAAEAVGGKGGGGRPDMAMAGGPDAGQAPAALDAVRALLKG